MVAGITVEREIKRDTGVTAMSILIVATAIAAFFTYWTTQRSASDFSRGLRGILHYRWVYLCSTCQRLQRTRHEASIYPNRTKKRLHSFSFPVRMHRCSGCNRCVVRFPRITKKCTGAAKPGVFKWTITRRGPVILDVMRQRQTRNEIWNPICGCWRFAHGRLNCQPWLVSRPPLARS